MRVIKVVRTVEVPDGATHFFGDLLDDPAFYKMTMVGVVGEHWWVLLSSGWVLSGHSKPHWVSEIKDEVEQ